MFSPIVYKEYAHAYNFRKPQRRIDSRFTIKKMREGTYQDEAARGANASRWRHAMSEIDSTHRDGERGPNAAELLALHGVKATRKSFTVATMAITDILACIIAGAETSPAAIARRFALSQSASGGAAILGTSLHAAPASAAFVNGVAGHVLDFDDMTPIMIGHPSVVLVPAILAIAQTRAMRMGDVLDAYVAGFEVAAWFGRRMIPAHYEAGWHSTSSIGVFGATAACARLLGLDAESMLNALGIAASLASGIRANFGSMTKSLHAGQAAEAGVRAAMLSAEGFTSNTTLFDRSDGYFGLYGTQSPARYTLAAGQLEIDTTGIGLKPYACCGAGVSVMDAAIDIFRRHNLHPAQIASAQCRVSAMASRIMPYENPADGLQAKYSLPYCVAVGLLDGDGGNAQFEDARVLREDVQSLIRRVTVTADSSMTQGQGLFGVELRVVLNDGRVLVETLDTPRGHPTRPMSDDALGKKFFDCVAPVLGQAQADHALAALRPIDHEQPVNQFIEHLCTGQTNAKRAG